MREMREQHAFLISWIHPRGSETHNMYTVVDTDCEISMITKVPFLQT
jgi:hypothetical protein